MKYINESLLDILSSLEKGEMPKEIGLDDFLMQKKILQTMMLIKTQKEK